MFRNILVATDGSQTAERALEQAIDLARTQNALLTVITVVPPLPTYISYANVDRAGLVKAGEHQAAQLLRTIADMLPEGVSVTTRVRLGQPAEEILAQIRVGAHDLLVLGSRGRGRVTSTLIGSVGAAVHFHTDTAMLVIHPHRDGDQTTA